MKKFIIITGLLFTIQFPSIYCQKIDYIRGKVVDSKTSQPVAYATVRLKDSQVGLISNADGDFRIPNNPKFQNDSVIVSCIGFNRLSLAFSSLKTSELNNLKLKPGIYALKEVNVTARRRKISPEVIVARALKNIKRNSPDIPFSYVSYYRDYQKDSNNYLNLNEAIILTLDKGFDYPSISCRYRLLDFRKNTDFFRMDMIPFYDLPQTEHSDVWFKKIPHAVVGDQNGNELLILLVHDAIRNFDRRSFSFIDTLTRNFLDNHKFSDPTGIYDGSTYLNKIDFTAKRHITGDSIRMQGSIFIQPDDYSIHKLEYSGSYLDHSEEKYSEIFNIEIEYGHEPAIDSRMCLKYISFRNSFTIPDSSDNDFFKIDKLEWQRPGGPYDAYPFPDMTIVSYFNRKIDPVLGDRIDNYSLTVGKRKAKITKVKVSGPNLYLTVRDDKFKPKELDSCNLSIKFLEDIDGNALNKRRELKFNQFRELFVQEYSKLHDIRDSCFIRLLPLELNCISSSDNSEKYWMNTPFKEAEKQKDSEELTQNPDFEHE